ncbi:MAG TPA: hypothetical protein EYM88_11665 [Gammaproteobacteria bacterium]|nr:hypothetical protein [Gammaproteobacteria bacterium]
MVRTKMVTTNGHMGLATAQWLETPLLQRDTLTNGLVVTGPAIVEQPDTTCVIDPGAVATVDDAGNLVIEVGGDN